MRQMSNLCKGTQTKIPKLRTAMMKLGFICKCNANVLPQLRLHLLLPPLLYSTSTSSINDITKVNSSSLSEFLVNSLGFDTNGSITVSSRLAKRRQSLGTKKVCDFNLIENAISVVNFFKQLGFQHCEIRSLVSREPRFFVSNVDKSLKPKIKLLNELGVCDSDLVKVVLSNPELLRIRLEHVIDSFRNVLSSDDDVILCLKRWSYFGGHVNMVPNVELLRNSYGVPIETIRTYVRHSPANFLVKTDCFRDAVVKVESMLGMDPHSERFVYGLQLLVSHDEKRLESKCAIFKSFGWTQSQLTELIMRNPLCFKTSESMIKRKLDFLMNQVGCTPDYLVTKVLFFTCSLEKRLLPRYRIFQILNKKRKVNHSFYYASTLTESLFVKRFVLPFEEVHELYAQLSGSKVGLLNVGKAKDRS